MHRYTEAYLFMYIIMIMDWIDLQAESKYVRAFLKSQICVCFPEKSTKIVFNDVFVFSIELVNW